MGTPIETCSVDRKFVVTDPTCTGSVLSIGISNDKSIFNATGAGQPIPDYEAEIFTPGSVSCIISGSAVAGGFIPMEFDITLGGEANGIPIEEGPSHVEFLVQGFGDQRVCSGGENADEPCCPGNPPGVCDGVNGICQAFALADGVARVAIVLAEYMAVQVYDGSWFGRRMGWGESLLE